MTFSLFKTVFYMTLFMMLSINLFAQRDTTEQINAPPFYAKYPHGGGNINPIDYDYAVKKSFETSADSVYGVLVGLLVVSVISMGIVNYRTNSKFIEVVNANTAVMQGLLAKIDTNDEKILNGIQKLLEGHRQEMQVLTTNLFTNLITQFIANMPRDKI